MPRDVDPGKETVTVSPASPAESPDGGARPHRPRLEAGDRVGRFLVVRRVDQGGMGVVYEARDETLGRRVALKLLLTAGGDSAHAARLVREARAVAGLSHPNVVAVYEVGFHDGSPFMAMEFVDGMTVRAWVAKASRGWREILDVFVQAGRGLAAAHAADIVHRDVKPDNILVGDDRVRVADFGLARNVGDVETRSGEQSPAWRTGPLTATGSVLGTPGYMAPEQTAGGTVDARADQYSFCLSLREALGERGPAWLRRVIARGTSQDPRERFPSMDALLAVLARDRRTRTLVAVAAGLVVASVGGVYLAARSTAPSPCRGGERRLAEVWDADVKARIAARFAAGPSYGPKTWRAVEAALDGYAAGWIDMQREACEATRVHGEQSEDMLGRRMECLEERRTALLVFGQSLLEAEPRVMDGAPQSALQLPAIDDCADRAHLAAGPPASATPRQSAAILASARLHGNEGKLEQSLDEARRAAEAARAEGDALHEAAALTQVGHTQNLLGDVNGAAETLRAAAEVAQRSGSRKAQMDVWTRQFYIYERQGQLESARDVVELAEQALRESPDRRRAAVLGYIRALLLLRSGEYPEANRAAERALALYVEAYGADAITLLHPLTLLSDILRSLGRLEESRAQAQRAVDLARGLGEDHPLLASARTYLAEVLRMMSRRKEAIGELELAAASYRRVHGENHGDLALVEMRLGLAFADEGRHAEALAHYEKARAIHEALGLDKSTNALFLRANSAVSLTALGRAAEAETIHREVLAAREKVIGPRHAEIAEHRRVLGNALARQGRLDEAWREYQSSLEVATAALGADHPDVAAVLRRMAEVERARGRFSAALALDTRAATIQEQKLAPDHDDRLEGRLFLALDHLGLASPRRALPLAEPAFAAFATRPAPALAVFARWVLGRALWESGDDRAAGMQLVQQARADITREGVRPDLAPEIDRWLSRR